MATAGGNTENLIQGVGYLYYATLDTPDPADGDIADPPGEGWRNLGFTQEGVSITIAQEYSELEVDQIVDVPGRRLTKREITVATSLAEATLENLAVALNGGTPQSGTGNQTFEPPMGNLPVAQPGYFKLIADGFAPGGQPRRFIVRKVLQVGEVEAAQTKDGQTVFPCEFAGHYVSSTVAPYKIIDAVASGS